MKNIRAVANGLVFSVFLSVPLIAEVITATTNNVPGTGFAVLLYEPFDFAYVILAGVLFLGLNSYVSIKKKKPIKDGIVFGVALLVVWFVVSFLAVGQLHISLGGKL